MSNSCNQISTLLNTAKIVGMRKTGSPYSVTVEQMKTSLNKQIIVGIAAGGTTLILLKGGDYKWLLLVGFTAILFVFTYVYKK